MDYESELARLLFTYGNDFSTFYSLLNSADPFSQTVDINSMYDFTYKQKRINYQFEIMSDQKDAFMATVRFLKDYGTHFSDLVIQNTRGTPVLSIHITKEMTIE